MTVLEERRGGGGVSDDRSVQAKADHGLAILDALADVWAAEVNLTSMIKNAVSPARLNQNAPDDVREDFIHRMEVQIDAIARQAFVEGAYRTVTGLQDEKKAMKSQVEGTIEFIKVAHGTQVDKAKRPYWLHPVRVMYRLGEDASLEEKLAALLHDVVEDTAWSVDGLRSRGVFPDPVLDAVALLTRPAGADRPTYMDYIRSIAASGNRIAIRVKIADNEENSDPVRIAALPPGERDIVRRYERSLAILRPALAALP